MEFFKSLFSKKTTTVTTASGATVTVSHPTSEADLLKTAELIESALSQ